MSFTNQQPFQVTQEQVKGLTRHGKRFNCSLCGLAFVVGDITRWVYANGTANLSCGNFFVCANCDGPTETVLQKAQESYKTAVTLAKQWGIYGPDWQNEL